MFFVLTKPQVCGQPEAESCTDECVAGCGCGDLWRHGDSCFETAACGCAGDLIFNGCGTPSTKICGQPEAEFYPTICVAGCGCGGDMWRHGDSCFETSDCGCTGDLTWNDCNSACPKICGEPAAEVCADVCVAGCGCANETWRLGDVCLEKCFDDDDDNDKSNKKATITIVAAVGAALIAMLAMLAGVAMRRRPFKRVQVTKDPTDDK